MLPLRQTTPPVAPRLATASMEIGTRWPLHVRNGTRPVRFRMHFVVATSLAAAWIHFSNTPASQEASSELSARRRSLVVPSSLLTRARPSAAGEAYISSSRRTHPSRRHTSTSAHAQQPPRHDEDGVIAQTLNKEADDVQQSSSSRELAELAKSNDINALMRHPALLKNIRAPRNPIVLCHGLYGFDVRGPFWGLEIHYWANVLDILRKRIGADVIVRGVPGTGAIKDRAMALHKFLISPEADVRGKRLNFIGHSMGGLDARYLISVIKPTPDEYTPVSLTCVNTPNRGSPFMDWCNANVGTGNDRVDEEIRRAKIEMRDSSVFEGRLSSGIPKNTDGERSEQAVETKGDDSKASSIVKPPFSLKTPLFVRPTKTKSEDKEEATAPPQDAEAEPKPAMQKLQNAVGAVTEGIAQMAATPTLSQLTPSSSTDSLFSSQGSATSSSDSEPKKDETKSSKNGVSLLDFKTFRRAISSISGSFSAYMLSVLDQPAYAMLSTRYMAQVFNPTVPDTPDVAYFSVAARKRSLPVYHPLWLPKLILDASAEGRTKDGERDGSANALGGDSQGNDGLVSVESAKWGTFLGVVENCDHWDLRGGGAPRWKGKTNPQTGKPTVEKSADEAKVEKDEKAKDDSAWIDINRLVRNLLSSKEKKGKGNKGEEKKKEEQVATRREEKKQEEQVGKERDEKNGSWRDAITSILPKDSETKSKEEQGLIDEVASWISDRLPKGDKDRRAQAEQAADAQEHAQDEQRKARESVALMDIERASTQEKTDNADKKEEPQNEQPPPKHILRTPSSELDVLKLSVKLRREAAWQEELGHDAEARELRRELAWHRAEWDRALAKTGSTAAQGRRADWDERSHNKNKNGVGEAKSIPSSSAEDLERFWIAICHLLWARGF